MTQRRIKRLESYMSANVLTTPRKFCCSHFKECRRSIEPGDRFREGILSHVGHRYDLLLDGRPLRIVVVGQEAGWPRSGKRADTRKISLEQRYGNMIVRSGLERSYYAKNGRSARNPHMRGTTFRPPRHLRNGTGNGSRRGIRATGPGAPVPHLRWLRLGQSTPMLRQPSAEQRGNLDANHAE